jgi:hypothetical protein
MQGGGPNNDFDLAIRYFPQGSICGIGFIFVSIIGITQFSNEYIDCSSHQTPIGNPSF